MVDPSDPAFELDTAVSADLDGELDAYARELGLPVAEVRAAISTPEGVARRSELAMVHAALGVARPPHRELDELTRRRLLAGAGVGASTARPARDRAWLLRAGVAAALTLVVMGALYALTSTSGDTSRTRASKAAGGGDTAAAVTGDVGDLGVIDAPAIARLLRGDRSPHRAGASSSADAPESATKRSDTAEGAAAPTPTVAPQAVDACAIQYGTAGSVRFRASGSYQGRPAVVLGIDTSRRTIVFVVAAADCTQVLYSASR